MSLPQRLTDYLRERRIKRIGRYLVKHVHEVPTPKRRALFAQLTAEVRARSAGQVARMKK